MSEDWVNTLVTVILTLSLNNWLKIQVETWVHCLLKCFLFCFWEITILVQKSQIRVRTQKTTKNSSCNSLFLCLLNFTLFETDKLQKKTIIGHYKHFFYISLNTEVRRLDIYSLRYNSIVQTNVDRSHHICPMTPFFLNHQILIPLMILSMTRSHLWFESTVELNSQIQFDLFVDISSAYYLGQWVAHRRHNISNDWGTWFLR